MTDQGGMWVWGSDFVSELRPIPRGAGSPLYSAVPVRWPRAACDSSLVVMVACGGNHTLALTRAGHVWQCGYGVQGPVSLAHVAEPERAAGVECITMVAAGARSCLVVAANGRLWSWGSHAQCPEDNDAPLGFVSV